MRYKLLIDTIDEKGIVYQVSKILYEYDCNIEENSEFVDNETDKFFMRTVFFSENIDIKKLKNNLVNKLPKNSIIKIINDRKKDIILMVTKENHCLGDILIRYNSDELDANILAVISNYDDLQDLSEKFNIPFFKVSHQDLNRIEHENKISDILKNFNFDFIILAKYMRILSENFVAKYQNKIINIHHSFLPAFIGANPYKQAHKRGVKIIGATSHFVTNDLDEGPIIFQDIARVNHNYTWKDMQKIGKDIEKVVLSKALNLALDDRIFIYGNKTIIF